MHCAGRAKLARQGFPLNPRAQHINNRREHLPRRHGLAPRPRLTLILPALFSLFKGDQRPHLGPQLLRYRPRLDLCHPGRYLRPALPCGFSLSVFTYQVQYYLRISSKSAFTYTKRTTRGLTCPQGRFPGPIGSGARKGLLAVSGMFPMLRSSRSVIGGAVIPTHMQPKAPRSPYRCME